MTVLRHWPMLSLAAATSACVAADWPQWRGPDRNGLAASSPALIEEVGRAGLEPVWRSEEIRSLGKGGYGSPVVANGRVYVYSNWKYVQPSPKRKLTERGLGSLGWAVGLPADVRQKVEAARTSEELAALDRAGRLEWVGQWVGKHVPGGNPEWRTACYTRLAAGRDGPPLETMAKLDSIHDQEFESAAAFDQWLEENVPDKKLRRRISRVVWTGKPMAYDKLFCLDAATGKTVWQTEMPGRNYRHSCSSTPCVADGRCYVLGSDSKVYCHDAGTGRQVWVAGLEAVVENLRRRVSPQGAHPLVISIENGPAISGQALH